MPTSRDAENATREAAGGEEAIHLRRDCRRRRGTLTSRGVQWAAAGEPDPLEIAEFIDAEIDDSCRHREERLRGRFGFRKDRDEGSIRDFPPPSCGKSQEN